MDSAMTRPMIPNEDDDTRKLVISTSPSPATADETTRPHQSDNEERPTTSTSSPASPPGTVTVSDIIDHIGFGPFQRNMLAICGLLFGVEACEIFLLTFIKTDIMKQFDANENMTSALTTVVFFGIFLGALGIGFYADKYGRRTSVLITILMPLIAGLLSAVSTEYWQFLLARFIVGLGVGGSNIAVVLFCEVIPTKSREFYTILCYSFWTVGVLFLCLFAFLLHESSWRFLVLVATLPYVISLIAYPTVFPESPHYLCVKGRKEEARWELQQIAHANGKTLPDAPIHVVHHAKPGSFMALLEPGMRRLSILTWIIWASASCSYYGMIMLSTQTILGDSGDAESFAAVALESCGEFPCYLAMMLCANRFGRKTSLIVSPVVAAVGLAGMRALYTEERDFANARYAALVIVAFFTRGTVLFQFDMAYLFTPEAMPSELRARGMGAASAAARVSSMATPFIAYALRKVNPNAPYGVYAACLLISSVCAYFLPFDTANRQLKEGVEDEEEAPPQSTRHTVDFGDHDPVVDAVTTRRSDGSAVRRSVADVDGEQVSQEELRSSQHLPQS